MRVLLCRDDKGNGGDEGSDDGAGGCVGGGGGSIMECLLGVVVLFQSFHAFLRD